MLAIVTKYHGPTDTRGSRVSASVDGRRAVVAYDPALDAEENHRRAMAWLCRKNCWDAARFFGGSLNGSRWAWVPVFTYDWEQRQKEQANA
jgi:hypothetical protein